MYAINYLPKREMAKSTTGCCPPFEPDAWDDKLFTFKDKQFMKFTTRSFLHIPLNMGSAITEAMAKRDAVNMDDEDEYFMLSYEVSPWRAEHYLSSKHEVPDAEMVRLSGTYLTKVFEGPFKNMGEWYQQLIDFVKSKGAKPIKTYFAYTTCPSCAKAYGKNYVIGFAQINTEGRADNK